MRALAVATVALAALSGGAGSVTAADLPFQRPVSAGVFSWTSWYVGGFAGAAWTSNSLTSSPCGFPVTLDCGRAAPLAAATETLSYTMTPSAIGGVAAGYNYQIPGSAIVFGFETEFGALRLKGSSAFATVPNLTAGATIGNWYNATTLRVGWAWDRLLFYGKGGLAVSTIETSLADGNGLLGTATAKRDVMGWAWGAGLEFVFAPNWSVKAEYLWLGVNHGVGVCAQAVPGAPAPGLFCSSTTSQAVQTAKIGINYLFGVGPTYARY